MSIRYTLRHNIPADMLAAEDVNDSSTWDLNLLRKHELAETDQHNIVYRQHNGEIVDWAQAATQHATELISEMNDIKDDMETRVSEIEGEFADIEDRASRLTEEAEQANTNAGVAVIDAQAARDTAQDYSEKAQEWAVKTDGMVQENGVDVDYSSKYYASQAQDSATQASDLVNNAFQTCTLLGSSSTIGEAFQLDLTGYKWIVFEVSITYTNNKTYTNAMCLPAAYLISQGITTRRFSVGTGFREDCLDFSFDFIVSSGITDWTAEVNYPTGTPSGSPTFSVFGIQ